MHSLLGQVAKLNAQEQLFRPDQHVLLALSGGVDSMVLLAVCAELRHLLPFPIQFQAAYVAVEQVSLPADAIDTLASVCRQHAVPFTTLPVYDWLIVDFNCYLCARWRRRALLEFAQQNGLDTIALGHHQDDLLETGLMNLIFHGRLESLSPRQPMLGGQITVIRPLLTIPKKHLLAYAQRRRLIYYSHACEYGLGSRREVVRKLLVELSQTHRPSRANLLKAIMQWQQFMATSGEDTTRSDGCFFNPDFPN